MTSFVTVHFHNAAPGKDEELTRWFRGKHHEDLARLRGFKAVDRFEVTPDQVMADIPQPWRYLSAYDFEFKNPEIDLPALGPLLAEARDGGLVAQDETERIWTYRMFSGWNYSGNFREGPLSHMMVLPANFVPGREAEYHKWYDDVHLYEVTETPGYVSMRRGALFDLQIEPRRFCPGSQIVMVGLQASNLAESLAEFIARSLGTSKQGVAHGPRSKSASTARTAHVFKRLP